MHMLVILYILHIAPRTNTKTNTKTLISILSWSTSNSLYNSLQHHCHLTWSKNLSFSDIIEWPWSRQSLCKYCIATSCSLPYLSCHQWLSVPQPVQLTAHCHLMCIIFNIYNNYNFILLKDHASHHVSIAHCQCPASVQCSPPYLSCHQPPYNLDNLYNRHLEHKYK